MIRFTSEDKARRSECSSGLASHHVVTNRNGITRACPGETGYRSQMANALRLLAIHSSGGTSWKGERSTIMNRVVVMG